MQCYIPCYFCQWNAHEFWGLQTLVFCAHSMLYWVAWELYIIQTNHLTYVRSMMQGVIWLMWEVWCKESSDLCEKYDANKHLTYVISMTQTIILLMRGVWCKQSYDLCEEYDAKVIWLMWEIWCKQSSDLCEKYDAISHLTYVTSMTKTIILLMWEVWRNHLTKLLMWEVWCKQSYDLCENKYDTTHSHLTYVRSMYDAYGRIWLMWEVCRK